MTITTVARRFKENAEGLREANPAWRPFVIKLSKTARRQGQEPDKDHYKLKQ